MKTLNIIGCGNVGRTLGRLWRQQDVFALGDVLNRSLASAQGAVDFMGAGRPVEQWKAMQDADLFLITVPDENLVAVGEKMAESGRLQAGTILFQCSGAIVSSDWIGAKRAGALTASVHTLKSFADPERSVHSFAGTLCGVEGNEEALRILCPAFEIIGARTFPIDPHFKPLYHAATIIVCNYLNALMEMGTQTYQKAGLSRDTAFEVMAPLVRGTVENIFYLDTTRALTGPIARGDLSVVEKHLKALQGWKPDFAELYRRLGILALQLSQAKGAASRESLDKLSRLLEAVPHQIDARGVQG